MMMSPRIPRRLSRITRRSFQSPVPDFLRTIVTTALGLLVLSASSVQAECRNDMVQLRGSWGTAEFSVEIADTPATRARGLQGRDSLGGMNGMLFIFERPGTVSFWMKDTRIPLDMLFISESGVVSKIHHNATPYDLTAIPGGSGISAVLEINGGLSGQFGLNPGTEVRHPQLEQTIAAWPCNPEG